MPDGPPAIQLAGLDKRYGDVHALDDVTLDVAEGEVFGLLGHNGAGKTTTVRILCGRTRPSGGRATVLGHDVVRERARIRPLINLVFADQNVYPRMSGAENLRFFADLYGVDRGRVDELLELVGLADAADRKASDYSTGMRQRLLIARALVNRPRVLFLDEPTRGLDPASARALRGLIGELSQAGTTIFLTTHDLEDADALCQRVGFLAGGRLVALDTPRELKLRVGERSVRVLLADRSEHVLRLDRPDDVTRLSAWLAAGEVLSVHSQEGTLADVFVALAGVAREGRVA
jgi:ABC-2 type transport system ATP-binding protein